MPDDSLTSQSAGAPDPARIKQDLKTLTSKERGKILSEYQRKDAPAASLPAGFPQAPGQRVVMQSSWANSAR